MNWMKKRGNGWSWAPLPYTRTARHSFCPFKYFDDPCNSNQFDLTEVNDKSCLPGCVEMNDIRIESGLISEVETRDATTNHFVCSFFFCLTRHKSIVVFSLSYQNRREDVKGRLRKNERRRRSIYLLGVVIVPQIVRMCVYSINWSIIETHQWRGIDAEDVDTD